MFPLKPFLASVTIVVLAASIANSLKPESSEAYEPTIREVLEYNRAERYSFNIELPYRRIALAQRVEAAAPRSETPKAAPAPKGDRKKMLANACDGNARCMCVNNAIFIHDSSWSTAGVGRRSLGPCNMRPPATWTPSVPFKVMRSVNGNFAKFETLQDGVTACVELWKRGYEDKSAFATAKIWTGNANNPKYGSKSDERAYINAIAKCD